MKIGFTLPNRGVLFGVTTAADMLDTAEIADKSGLINSVWVGDSLFGKPRMESIALLAGIAGRTKQVRLGPACMASFPLRDPVQLAYQWASLDLLAEGRTVLVTCTGIVEQAGYDIEQKTYGVTNKDRVERLSEWITILKLLWTEDNVSFEGNHYRFENVTIEPKGAAQPRPAIWIANNAFGDREKIQRTHRRVARHADGWQTAVSDPEDLAWRLQDIREQAEALGRDPITIETHLYHNININENKEEALDESKRFLDLYYTADYTRPRLESWVATGSPEQCIEHLKVFEQLGFDEVTVRITAWDQRGQLQRLLEEVAPHFQQPDTQSTTKSAEAVAA
jgi:alkanesulfonate monooxygenase SsuD/methylene tetrahydromethanopterin reductase-like flavin-dependent oxidoreductase (luciferase family)